MHPISFRSPHLPLWFEYTGFFVIIVLLLPCLWISYIWDQVGTTESHWAGW